jgi:hypothetical protein
LVFYFAALVAATIPEIAKILLRPDHFAWGLRHTAHADYMAWLLDEAQQQGLEAVVWWLNRDYLDDAVTGGQACPCLPESDSTCFFLDPFYDLSGNTGEILQRMFGNMALRYYDGSPRPGLALWKGYLRRRYQP